MKLVPTDTKGRKLFIADFASLWVNFLIQPAMHFKPFIGACRADEVDHDLMGYQWHAPPIARDMAEQAMLDLFHLLVPGG